MKVSALVLLILISVSYGLTASPEPKTLSNDKIASENYKVIALYFNGTPEQSAAILEQKIIEQTKNDWYYDSYIDLDNDNFDSKLLVFKRVSKK